ncbi:MAG TPA: ASCH domain-containing protein [Bryobacteraceae bacterium]|nr:ASCH domain-containing protein [Bryobacteraceae bacterium]
MEKLIKTDFEKKHVGRLLSRAQASARKNNLKFDLTREHLLRLWDECGGCCAISGRFFSLEEFECLVRHPFAPSVDRIDSHDGYTVINTRLVCVAVNFGMNQWGQEVYYELAKAAAKRGGLEEFKQEWLRRQQAAYTAWETRKRKRAAKEAWETRRKDTAEKSRMKVLTIRQPWAWLIVNGYKDIENRSWATHYRGPLLIQASASLPSRKDLEGARAFARKRGVVVPEDLETGGIIGLAFLDRCVSKSRSKWFEGPIGCFIET